MKSPTILNKVSVASAVSKIFVLNFVNCVSSFGLAITIKYTQFLSYFMRKSCFIAADWRNFQLRVYYKILSNGDCILLICSLLTCVYIIVVLKLLCPRKLLYLKYIFIRGQLNLRKNNVQTVYNSVNILTSVVLEFICNAYCLV